MPPERDDEVEAFVQSQPRHLTFSEVAEACHERFGAERAWSRDEIIAYWHSINRPRPGPASMIDQDVEVRLFLEDRLGRMTLNEIVEKCKFKFGASRTPSRTSIHVFWKKLRSVK
jgi:hypothetical protein